MEFFFTASYNGIEARLVFPTLWVASEAKKNLIAKGCVCTDIKPVLADINRDFRELAAAKKFIEFAHIR